VFHCPAPPLFSVYHQENRPIKGKDALDWPVFWWSPWFAGGGRRRPLTLPVWGWGVFVLRCGACGGFCSAAVCARFGAPVVCSRLAPPGAASAVVPRRSGSLVLVFSGGRLVRFWLLPR